MRNTADTSTCHGSEKGHVHDSSTSLSKARLTRIGGVPGCDTIPNVPRQTLQGSPGKICWCQQAAIRRPTLQYVQCLIGAILGDNTNVMSSRAFKGGVIHNAASFVPLSMGFWGTYPILSHALIDFSHTLGWCMPSITSPAQLTTCGICKYRDTVISLLRWCKQMRSSIKCNTGKKMVK